MAKDEDKDLRKIFERFEKLLFKAANDVKTETPYSYVCEFSKRVDAATAVFKQQSKRFVDKTIPDVNFSEEITSVLRRKGAFHETANVKLTTYIQMVSQLNNSAEQFKGRIQSRIDEDEKDGVTTTVTDLREYIKDELRSGHGLIIEYKNGAKMPVDKYAAMLAQTTRIETHNIAMVGKALNDGNDLVECSTIYPTCPNCACLQGRIYSISGNTPGYPSLYDTAFKHGYSIIHPNCRHQWFPYNPKFHTAEENKRLQRDTLRPWDDDNAGGIDEKQREAYREQYAKSQMQMRQWNKELNTYAEYKEQCYHREEAPRYMTLGAFRRAYRLEEGSLAYARTHYFKRDAMQFEEFKEVLGAENIHKSLEEFQEMKYNKKDEFALYLGYKTAQQDGDIYPLVSFKVYKAVSQEIDRELVGKSIGNIAITGKTTHFINRVIGQYQESDYKQSGKRQGVPIEALKSIVKANPKPAKRKVNARGERSISFNFNGYALTVDPDNGKLIQTNKVHK